MGDSPRAFHRTSSTTSAVAASESRLLELSAPLLARRLETAEETQTRTKRLAEAMKVVLECLGEDSSREGLVDTPARAAEALLFWTRGYCDSLPTVVNDAVFSEDHNEMVLVGGIDVFSLCEHHLAPFHGKAHVGYIPDGRVLGLSKIARVVEMFARRLQVQERLTTQICEAIMAILQPRGVAVIIECTHMCMASRGVQKPGSTTKTSSVRGVFKTDPRTRQEFFSLVYGKSA